MNLNRSLLHVALLALFVGCSQQGEGERCLNTNNNEDCDSALVCTNAEDLEVERTSKFPTSRCCPSVANAWSDARCQPKGDEKTTTTPTTGTAGAAGATTSASHAGNGGMSVAGADHAGSPGVMSDVAGSAGSGT